MVVVSLPSTLPSLGRFSHCPTVLRTWPDLACLRLSSSVAVFPLKVSHAPALPTPALRHPFQDQSPCDIFNTPQSQSFEACAASRRLRNHLTNISHSSLPGETKKTPPPNTFHASLSLVTYLHEQQSRSSLLHRSALFEARFDLSIRTVCSFQDTLLYSRQNAFLKAAAYLTPQTSLTWSIAPPNKSHRQIL